MGVGYLLQIRNVGTSPVTITEIKNLCLRFETPGGPLVLRKSFVCFLQFHFVMVSVICYYDAVIERLGYDPCK